MNIDVIIKKIPIKIEAKRLGLVFDKTKAVCFICHRDFYCADPRPDPPPEATIEFDRNLILCPKCQFVGNVVQMHYSFYNANGKGDINNSINELKKIYHITEVESAILIKDTVKSKHVDFKTGWTEIYEHVRFSGGPMPFIVKDYLNDIGINDEIINHYKITFIADIELLLGYLKTNYTEDTLRESGVYNKQGEFVFKKHRIIIPYFDGNNSTVYLRGMFYNEQQITDPSQDEEFLKGYIPKPPRFVGLNLHTNRILYNPKSLADLPPTTPVYICDNELDAMYLTQQEQFSVCVPDQWNQYHSKLFKDHPIRICFDKGSDIAESLISENCKKITTKIDPIGETETDIAKMMFFEYVRGVDSESIKDQLLKIKTKIAEGIFIIPDIADYLADVNHIIFKDSTFWLYDNRTGYWQKAEEYKINNIIRSFLRQNCPLRSSPKDIDAIRKNIEDIIKERSEHITQTQNQFKNFLNTKTGMLNVVSGKLYPHHLMFYSFYQYPIKYDPAATAPMFHEFIDYAMNSDSKLIDHLRNYIAYILSDNTDFQFYAHIIGTTGTGKSTLGKILIKLIGKENSTTLSLHNSNSDFFLQKIIGKKFILINELDELHLSPNTESVLKALTGFDMVSINRKHRDEVDYYSNAKIMILSNNFPQMHDSSGAMFRRLNLFEWNKKISEENARRWIADTNEFQSELPGIFNWIVEGYREILKKGIACMLPKPEQMELWLDEYRTIANQIRLFVSMVCDLHPNYKATNAELYDNYLIWFKEEGKRDSYKYERSKFFRSLLQSYIGEITDERKNNCRLKKGIRIKPDWLKAHT